MCANCEMEHVKRCMKISELPIGSTRSGKRLLEDLKYLSEEITEVCDVKLAEVFTEVYEDLTSHCVEFIDEYDKEYENLHNEIDKSEAEMAEVSSVYIDLKGELSKCEWELGEVHQTTGTL